MAFPDAQTGDSPKPARQSSRRDLVIGSSPFGRPDARLVAAVVRTGALGILDLGGPADLAIDELAELAASTSEPFGVRVTRDCDLRPADLNQYDDRVHWLVLGADLADDQGSPWQLTDLTSRYRVMVEVTSAESAQSAIRLPISGLIAVGHEAAGRVGGSSSFVLLQELLAMPVELPVLVRGGIGGDTAAAAVAGGATGVVLDTQLSMLAEAETAHEIATRCRLDAETTVVAGYRVQVPVTARIDQGALDTMTAEQVLASLRAEPAKLAFTPLGQDGFLAAAFATKYTTVARALAGVRAAIDAVLDPRQQQVQAAARTVVSSGSPLCTELGLRVPIVQGPMSRVSDTPAFAMAIAEDGALPVLALALADRQTATELLQATGELLGERPWGVGILGFAAQDVLEAQLDAIAQVRPAAAIVAGGTPAQAARLEQHGTAAFLHVPSAGLLRQYLDAGARRFVFEGWECGGHVGPTASFPLWQAQLAVLAEHGDLSGVQVLFAGGIHDARSAAMVAAAAAPAAARGAAVGLLMGTAYLFTEEAVETGAILAEYQRQMLEARATTLLRTAPGHLTRCVPSPYVDMFDQTRAELSEQGVTGRQAWSALEELNVGRLRLASKGVERDGADLVAVDEQRQQSDGLYMAGQVVGMRDRITTIGALHREVTLGADGLLTAHSGGKHATPAGQESDRTAQPVDIAIVGMACMFPKASDMATYWANVVGAKDVIEPVPAHRWDPSIFYSDQLDGQASGRYTPSKWGGFLPRVPFDPLRYGIPPTAMASVEPVQFLSLEVARKALEDARLMPGTFDPDRTAVIFGTETNSEYLSGITLRGALPAFYGEVPEELEPLLPKITSDTFPGILGNIIASRISNRLGLAGPAYVVDAACASSLAALDMACKELVFETADTVLCGAADLHNGHMDYLMFSSVGALSPAGRAKPFDASADGTTLAEGVACVVLKRLADAERDGDRVYAVIKGVAGASDGRSLGLTAPRAEGQALAMRRAYQRAGMSPARIGLVEAHGTGTVVGDQTELESLTQVYAEAGARPGATQLGSVKSQMGHAKTAAGLAGVIKVALAIHKGVRPPTLHVTTPNPAWHGEISAFCFADKPRPWPKPPAERAAAVSAFGFGGANYHAVLTGYQGQQAQRHGLDQWPAELFLFRGHDRAAAMVTVASLQRLLTTNETAGRPWRLRDLARTAAAWATSGAGAVQLAIVATDLDDLEAALELAVAGQSRAGMYRAVEDGAAQPGRMAMLFPGQGSQRLGMFAELLVAFPQLQEYLRCDEDLTELMYPPSAFDQRQNAAARAALTDTRVAQPALGVAGLAAGHLLDRLGIQPDLLGGHSYGELVALSVAGAYDAQTLLRLSAARGRAIVAAAEQASGGEAGTMAAVRGSADRVAEVLARIGVADQVIVANQNAPDQVVISGTTDGVAAAVSALAEDGCQSVPLDVACAFHSPLVSAAVERFAQNLAEVPVASPRLPVYANRTASPYPSDPDAVCAELAAQVGAPVRFVDQIEAMYAAGARIFVEAGPGRVLTRLVTSILGDRAHTAVAVDAGTGGIRGLLDAVAQLAVAGVVPRTGWLYHGRDALDLTDVTPPRQPAWAIDGRAVVTADGKPLPGGLCPARLVRRPQPAQQPVTAHHAAGQHATGQHMAGQQVAGQHVAVPAAASGPVAGHLAGQPAGSGPAVGWATPSAGVQQNTGTRSWNSPGWQDPGDHRQQVVTEFLRTSRDMLAQQRDVVLSYLGVPLTPPVSGTTLVPQQSAALEAAPVTHGTWAGQEAPAMATGTAAEPTATVTEPVAETERQAEPALDVPALVLAVICESTGYPADMVEPDLDLETDLSIDSIKRTEIAGIMIRRLGSPEHLNAAIDELTKLRTAAAITTWLSERLDTQPAAQPPSSTRTTPIDPVAIGRAPVAQDQPSGSAPTRYLVQRLPQDLAPVPGGTPLAGWTLAVVGETQAPVTERLTAGLVAMGAEVLTPTGDPSTLPTGLDAVVNVAGWRPEDGRLDLPDAYHDLRSVVLRRPSRLLGLVPMAKPEACVAGSDQRPVTERAAGLRGLLRTIAAEYPTMATGMLELDQATAVADGQPSAAVAAELLAARRAESPETPAQAVVASRTDHGRQVATLRQVPLDPPATAGGQASGPGVAEAAAMGLDSSAVVLLVGGARGITAGLATLLASATGCRLELLGRSAAPSGAEDPRTAGALDERQLRQAVTALGVREPRQVRDAVARVLAEREIRATIAGISGCASVRYHQADVLDAEALATVVDKVYAEHGRIDGVVYAAGMIDDRLIEDKDPTSFRRVFTTKVSGATTLLSTLEQRRIRPAFVTLFGSIAGVAGNRGQSDYAAANDALETLGALWAARTGIRTVTVHWGPWAPTATHQGMVSPELCWDFARRGIGLIDQTEGHLALLRELAWGDRRTTAVVYTAGGWNTPANDGTNR